MKKYLELYLQRNKDAGASTADIYQDTDFTDLETLLAHLPGRLQETPVSGRNMYAKLAAFANELWPQDLCDLMEDILYEVPECVDTIFETTKYGTPAENAFDWLMVLPYATLKKLEDCLESIFHQTLHSNDPRDRRALSKIKSIVAYNKVGLRADFLVRAFENTATKEQLTRLELLTLLANLEESESRRVGESFWASIDLQEEPWLAPGVISAYKYVAPEKALKVLRRVSAEYPFREERIRTMLMRSIETTLSQLLRRHTREEAVELFEREVQSLWAHSRLLEIIENIAMQGVEIFNPFIEVITALEHPRAADTPTAPERKVKPTGVSEITGTGTGESLYHRIGDIVYQMREAHNSDEVDRIVNPREFDFISRGILMDRLSEEYDFGRIMMEVYQRATHRLYEEPYPLSDTDILFEGANRYVSGVEFYAYLDSVELKFDLKSININAGYADNF